MVYAYNANETTHSESEIPWYQPLCGSFWSISGFRQTHLGRVCTHGLVCTMELLRIAPKGSAQVRGVASSVCGTSPWRLLSLPVDTFSRRRPLCNWSIVVKVSWGSPPCTPPFPKKAVCARRPLSAARLCVCRTARPAKYASSRCLIRERNGNVLAKDAVRLCACSW